MVNITKFGAFVNILPGRDGLLHISKLGKGKRVERVEDVLDLGDEIAVRVDDVDPQGKVSLSLVADLPEGDGEAAAPRSRDDSPAPARDDVASFEDSFDAEVRAEFGDLGPEPVAGPT